MIISCVIIEDEPLAIERAKDYISKFPWLILKGVFETGVNAVRFLENSSVDLILLDINIGTIDGITLLESVNTTAEIVFTTAYNEFAIKGYEFNITDYLLKPYTFERFTIAVERAKKNIANKNNNLTDHIFIKTGTHLERINFDEILYIEGMGDYRCIYCTNKRVMTLQTFYELEKLIPSHIVCRVHKSYMVSLKKIEAIEKDQIKVANKYISISDTYRNVIKIITKR
ncbi:MAG: response regulator transcription factor [Limnohabitans sp.]|nr:response regulator transcription factor [Limnohabitans sp.]